MILERRPELIYLNTDMFHISSNNISCNLTAKLARKVLPFDGEPQGHVLHYGKSFQGDVS